MKKSTALAFGGVLIAGAIAVAACGSSQAPADESLVAANDKHQKHKANDKHEKHKMMNHDADDKCPMKVDGTTARAEESEGVAVLAFSTTSDVGELQGRVGKMVAMHDKHHRDGGHEHMAGMKKPGKAGHDHAKHGAKKMKGEHLMAMPASSARSENTEDGARVVLTPKNPDDLQKLRAHVEKMATKMAGGDCPMMAPPGEGDEQSGHVHPSPK